MRNVSYASDPHAFQGRERLIEVSFGADLSEAVTNADLSFMTRDFARELPERLRAREDIDRGVGALAELQGWPLPSARTELTRAARLVGVPTEQVVRMVLALVTVDGS